jgi:hypothetical protein
MMRSTRLAMIATMVAIGAGAAVDARAASVPAGTVVRMERAVDTAAFARAIDRQFHITLRHVVATDIDRDGDLDIVASTDRGFMVWVNDGDGRLTKQSPKHAPMIEGAAPVGTWRHGRSHRELTVQNDAPTPGAENSRAHAPPLSAQRRSVSDRAAHRSTPRNANASRAPPRKTC